MIEIQSLSINNYTYKPQNRFIMDMIIWIGNDLNKFLSKLLS